MHKDWYELIRVGSPQRVFKENKTDKFKARLTRRLELGYQENQNQADTFKNQSWTSMSLTKFWSNSKGFREKIKAQGLTWSNHSDQKA